MNLSTSGDVNLMCIDGEINEDQMLNAVWVSNNQIATFVSPKNQDSVDDKPANINKNSGNVQILSWNNDLSKPVAIKLVHQSRIIFASVQELRKKQNVSSFENMLLEYSRKYRCILRSCFLDLKAESRKHLSNPSLKAEVDAQIELYSMLELIWSLCEILLIEKLPEGLVIMRLMNWCNWHFPISTEPVNQCTSADNTVQHPSYWTAVYSLLLQGKVMEACNLLRLNRVIDSPDYQIYSSIDELLRKRPSLASDESTVNDFEWRWQNWLSECKRRLKHGDFDSIPEVKTVCRILCGERKVFEELHELCGNWYHLLISYLFYNNPIISSFEIYQQSSVFLEIFGGIAEMSTLDNILLHLFRFDISVVIDECCRQLSNWWLPVHLTDLLLSSNSFSFHEDKESDQKFRESLVLTYAEDLSKQAHNWSVVACYLANSGPNSLNYLRLFLQRIPFSNDMKAAKIKRLCKKYQLINEERSIQRQQVMRNLQVGRIGGALCWSIIANDESLTNYLTDNILQDYIATGNLKYTDLIDNLGSLVLVSERLAFLNKYREFQKLHSEGQVNEAAILLVNLLVSKAAPSNLRLPLMINCIPLLDNEKPTFGVEETTALLVELNKLQQSKDIQKTTKENEEKLTTLRFSLVENLARAFLE